MPRGNVGVLGSTPMLNTQIQQAQQPQQPQPQQQGYSGPDLSDLTYFNNRSMGGVEESEMNSERAQKMLGNLRQVDPSAAFMPSYSGDGNLIGYTLNFNASKLPGVNGQGQLSTAQTGVGTGSTFMPRFSTVQDKMNLMQPGSVYKSSPYGQITDNRNIYDKKDWLDYVGPLAVAGFGGLLGGLGPILSAAQGAQGALRSGNPWALASAALPFIPGMGGLPGMAAKFAINQIGRRVGG